MKYLYIVVIATPQFIFFVYFFSKTEFKKCENNEKKISFNGQIFVLPSVCYYALRELKFGIKYDLFNTCIKCFEIFKKIFFYPHKFRFKPTFARTLLHVKFVNILK